MSSEVKNRYTPKAKSKKDTYKNQRISIKIKNLQAMSNQKESEGKTCLTNLIENCMITSFYDRVKRNAATNMISNREKINSDILKSINILSEKKSRKPKKDTCDLGSFFGNENDLTFRAPSTLKDSSYEKSKSPAMKTWRKTELKLNKYPLLPISPNSTINNKNSVSTDSRVKKFSTPKSSLNFKPKDSSQNEFNYSETFSINNEFSKFNFLSRLENAKFASENDLPLMNHDITLSLNQSNNCFKSHDQKSKLSPRNSSKDIFISRKDFYDNSRNSTMNKIFSTTKSPLPTSHNITRRQSNENACGETTNITITKSSEKKIKKESLMVSRKETFRKLKNDVKEDKFKILKLEMLKNNQKVKNIVENLKKCQNENESIKKNFCKVDYLEKKLKKKYFDHL